MPTKPFSLQSPEQIAKDYGGNKQKIAEAMQLGVLDPTAGTLAAMFIDRMRNAAQQEQVPQQTVAQQVFAPPQSQMPQGVIPPGAGAAPPIPAGLGATPEAAAMPPMDGAQMAPPPMGVPGMAMGGEIGGGLTSLPVPDDMFDEPNNGGYAGGGIVSFKTGNKVETPNQNSDLYPMELEPEDETPVNGDGVAADVAPPQAGDIVVTGQKKPKQNLSPLMYRPRDMLAPKKIYAYEEDPRDNLDTVNELAPRETKEAQRYRDYINRVLSPEGQKKQRKQDMWMALGQIGATMATTPGSLLQAASTGMQSALPGISAAAKERRAGEQAAYQALVGEERAANKELQDRANIALDLSKTFATEADAMKDRGFKDILTRLGFNYDYIIAQMTGGMSLRGVLAGVAANRELGFLEYGAKRGAFAQQQFDEMKKSLANDPNYIAAQKAGKGNQYIWDIVNPIVDRYVPDITNPLGLGRGRRGS